MTFPRLIALTTAALGFSATAIAQAVGYTFTHGDYKYTIIDSENKYVSVALNEESDQASSLSQIIMQTSATDNDITYTVTKVADSGFKDNTAITYVKLNYSIVEIGEGAFSGCTSLRIMRADDCTSLVIRADAFSGCTSLTTAYAYSVDDVGASAFSGCTSLTTVMVHGQSIANIGASAFSGCTSLTSFDMAYVSGSIGDNAFANSGLTSVTTSTTLTSLGEGAFAGCKSLGSVSIKSTSLTEVAAKAFADCVSLTGVSLTDGIEAIGDSTFAGCTSLGTLPTSSSLRKIGDYAFASCTSLEGRLEFPQTMQEIGSSAFAGCTSLTEVCLPKSVTYIGATSFSGCDLTRVTFEGQSAIGGEVTPISADQAFESLASTSLKEAVIGEGIPNVSQSAFARATSLKYVTLPSTLVEIGDSAFYKDEALSTVKCYAFNPPTLDGTDCFTGINGQAVLYVPLPDLYESWSGYFGGGIKSLYAFALEDDKPTIGVDGEVAFFDAFRALSNESDANPYRNADLLFKGEMAFSEKELDYADLSATNVFAAIEALPTVGEYGGAITGSAVTNLAARSAGLFGTLGETAEVNSLVLLNSVLYVDLSDEAVLNADGDAEINILARRNSGKVKMFGFSGDIIVDSELADGKDISVSLVDENDEDAEINGFLRIGDIRGTGDNKRCITIKQNLGVKRPAGKKVKVATSKAALSNKAAAFDYTEEELMKPVREFSDEEFAQGAVAYWLNYSGPGYTGDYTGQWSQGKAVPVPATTVGGVSNALYKVDYVTDADHVTDAPLFANNGSQITIAYDQKPEQVTVGGVAVKDFGEESVTLTFDHSKPISILFLATSSALPAVPQSSGIEVAVSGKCVTVSGADGDLKTLTSLTGQRVGSTTGRSLTAPHNGVYLLQVGGTTKKIVVK